MAQVICKGVLTQTIYAEGDEAAVHQFLNTNYPTYKVNKTNELWHRNKQTLSDPIFPEPLSIWKVRNTHEK